MSVTRFTGGVPTEKLGLVAGLGATSAALSSGFIWAYQGRTWLVFGAAFVAWTGYLVAHYAVTGEFIDPNGGGDDGDDGDGGGYVPEERWRRVGVAAGAAILVAGMVVGVVYIRAENHLATNVGGVLFLGGYVVAHYAATGELL